MAISSDKLRQSIVLLVVISIVGALLSIYFFVYIDTREEEINKRNFNALTKGAQNIQQKIVEYNTKNVTGNYIKYNLDYILRAYKDTLDNFSYNDTITKNILKYEVEIRDHHELTLESLETKPYKKSRDDTRKKTSINGKIEWIDQKLKFSFHDTLVTCLTDPTVCSECNCKDRRKVMTESTIPVELFIEPLLRNDIFDEYVIVNPSKSGGEFLVYKGHSLGSSDSLRVALKPSLDKIMLNGTTYKVFRFPFSAGKYNWVLMGLQDYESYLKEARSFDLVLLYTILLVAFILLLSLPLIKIVLISRNEKLNKADVILCGISLLMGCFFWTIIISEWDNHHLYREDAEHNNIIDALSTSIEKKFIEQIDSAYRELSLAENSGIDRDLVDVLRQAPICDTARSRCYTPEYKNFENIIWIDSTGRQTRKWATRYKANSKINVSTRAYFHRVRDRREWPWKGADKIVIESIRSWNNSEYLAVISRESSDPKLRFPVLGISSSLRSVIHCTLPFGYKFCIADQQGNVWFHSDVNKNLSENVFEECDLDPSINMILYNVGEKSTVLYENKKHHIDIRPLATLPLYLITMKDLSLEGQSKAYVLQVTFVFLLTHMLIITFTILTIGLTWRRSLKRHITMRSLDWLKPDTDRGKLYVSIGLLNFAIAVLLVLFALLVSPLDEIIILGITSLYVLPVYYLSLNNQTLDEFPKPVNQTLLGCILLSLVVLNVTVFVTLDASWPILLYQLLLVMLIIAWLLLASYLRKKSSLIKILKIVGYKGILKSISLRTAYSLAFSSLCFIVGVIPVFEFHRHAFNLERIKNMMATQYQMVKESSTKPRNGNVYMMNGMDTVTSRAGKYTSVEYFKNFDQLTKLVSPVINTSGLEFIKRDEMFYAYVQNRRWFWDTDSVHLYFVYKPPDGSEKATILRSKIQTYDAPQRMGVIMGIIGLIWLFVSTRYLTGRIFIFDINRNLVEADLFIVQTDNKRMTVKDQEQLMEPFLNNHLFIIGLPFSGERDYIDKMHPPEREKRLVIDLVDVSNTDQWNLIISQKAANEKYEVIIVDHFEHDFLNIASSNSKLVLMEKLFLMWKKKIVVLSTIHPSLLIGCYGEDEKSKERWNAVFSHFYNIYYPLQREKLSKENIMKGYGIDGKKWNRNQHYYEFIERECSHGLFLQNLKPAMYSLVDIANKNKLTIEELSDKVKSLAYTYYASIWSSCSKDERFLIYDLAEDGLVNIKNDEVIVQLIYKGIFIQRRTLSIMNRSFRNFVLSYVNPSEVLEMRKETLSHGTWSRVKGPIIFILCIAILFLLYTQKGFSTQIMAFLSTIAAGIPLILKLLTLVETPSKPKDKPV